MKYKWSNFFIDKKFLGDICIIRESLESRDIRSYKIFIGRETIYFRNYLSLFYFLGHSFSNILFFNNNYKRAIIGR